MGVRLIGQNQRGRLWTYDSPEKAQQRIKAEAKLLAAILGEEEEELEPFDRAWEDTKEILRGAKRLRD